MKNTIEAEYQKISDKISYEDFQKRMEKMKKDYEDVSFMDDLDIARMIVGEFINEENVPLTDLEENKMDNISKLEVGAHNQSLIGRVMRISNVKTFIKKKKGDEGKVANLMVADDTGEMRVVLWTENIKLLKKVSEGDLVKITDVDVKEGFRGGKEAHLHPRSTIEKVSGKDFNNFPEYEEKIINISDIKGEMQASIIARITRISRLRTFNSNGREGKFQTLDLKDKTGSIPLTLWNKDVDIIKELDLKEGDSIKVLEAQSRVRNGEVNLAHSWMGRIIKDDFDVPEHEESVIKIGDAHEMRDVTLIGIVNKVQDTINFQRSDGSTGYVKSIGLADETGRIKVTLWNDDTNLKINKGDILKITGGNIEFDEYSETGYRVNTGWSSKLIINPEIDEASRKLLEEYKQNLEPLKVKDLSKIDEEGQEIDTAGRIMNIYEPNEFQRSDGTKGIVRSIEIADDTGIVRASCWDDKANLELEKGDAVRIENARTRFRVDKVELSIGKTCRVIKLDENESQNIPPIDKIEETLYENKEVEEIEEEDQNIKVDGSIIEAYGERILYHMCPNCNKKVEFIDETYVCDFCGEEVEEPNYLMIIPCMIEDDTGNIRVTFFRKQAEELIGMKTGEANEVISKTADEGSLAGKVEDLIGRNITIIADASFDEYNEEVRLIAKKIVDMEL